MGEVVRGTTAGKIIVPPRLRLWAGPEHIANRDHSFCIAVHLLSHLEPNAMIDLDKSLLTGEIDLTWDVSGAHFWNLHNLLTSVAPANGSWYQPCYPYFHYEFAVAAEGPRYDRLHHMIEKGGSFWHKRGSFFGYEFSLTPPAGYTKNHESTVWVTGQDYDGFSRGALSLARYFCVINQTDLPPPQAAIQVRRWKRWTPR